MGLGKTVGEAEGNKVVIRGREVCFIILVNILTSDLMICFLSPVHSSPRISVLSTRSLLMKCWVLVSLVLCMEVGLKEQSIQVQASEVASGYSAFSEMSRLKNELIHLL